MIFYFSYGVVVNPIDLLKMKEKVCSYKSLYEFYVDAQWIEHNCEVLFTGEYHLQYRSNDFLTVKREYSAGKESAI